MMSRAISSSSKASRSPGSRGAGRPFRARRRHAWRIALASVAVCSVATAAPAAWAEDAPADGEFVMTTSPGVLPALTSDGIRLAGLNPASVVTNATTGSASATLPIVARNGTANATGGGLRFTNNATAASVICANPVVDTKARVIDCVIAGSANRALFTIHSLGARTVVTSRGQVTQRFTDMVLRVADSPTADYLNRELQTNAFSPYVNLATADLTVTTPRSG